MLRGTTTFRCTKCKKVFKGPDLEWRATVYSTPCECPQCGSNRTMPLWAFWQLPVYRKIWNSVSESQGSQISEPVRKA